MNSVQTLELPFPSAVLRAYAEKATAAVRGCIFYFHGGGLVFGDCNDLPDLYKGMFLRAGYDLIRLEYPLAPESSISEILEAIHFCTAYLVSHPGLLGYETMPPYILFGRSAGAYLSLMEARRICCLPAEGETLPRPRAVLSFYGYHAMDLPEFLKPAPFYLKMPAVPKKAVEILKRDGIVTAGPLGIRYSIYVYGRQTGDWSSLMGISLEEISDYTIPDTDFSLFPPCFFTASSGDQDVPFRESKQMARKIPGSIFHPVYYLEHDFDRDITKPDGRTAYEKAIAWLDQLS